MKEAIRTIVDRLLDSGKKANPWDLAVISVRSAQPVGFGSDVTFKVDNGVLSMVAEDTHPPTIMPGETKENPFEYSCSTYILIEHIVKIDFYTQNKITKAASKIIT